MGIQTQFAQPFRWARARNTGPSHCVSGLPCQDSVSVATFTGRDGNPWITAALADGAGSAVNADDGAAYAVQCFNEFIIEALCAFDIESEADFEDILRRGVELITKTLSNVANNNNCKSSAYAATFLGCVSRSGKTAFVQIGDGAMVFGNTDNWHLALTPYQGTYANESCFITDPSSRDRLQLTITDDTPQTILMFSDGLEDLLISGPGLTVRTSLPNLLDEALKSSQKNGLYVALCLKLKQLLQSPAVTSRSDDDTSIIAIFSPRPD